MKTKFEWRKTALFAFMLSCVLAMLAWIQMGIFSYNPAHNLFVESYLFNGGFAVMSYMMLLLMNRKNPSLTGFVFMASSALKFLVFCLCFYPIYYADGSISRIEFSSFFAPYAICLTAELVFFVRF